MFGRVQVDGSKCPLIRSKTAAMHALTIDPQMDFGLWSTSVRRPFDASAILQLSSE
jgi:hypothetical protein